VSMCPVCGGFDGGHLRDCPRQHEPKQFFPDERERKVSRPHQHNQKRSEKSNSS
jgi:hypothetical protein